MRVIRKELAAAQVYPASLRYDETGEVVQYSPDGGTTWIDSPENDPRLNNHYPPLDTSDPVCDAAARMVALLQDIEASNEDALQAGAAAAEIATAILLLLAFIPLIGVITAVIIGEALQLITIGYAAVHAAFLGFDWDELACWLSCILKENGVLNDDGFEFLKSYIADTYTITQQTVLLGILNYTGRAGLNDAAAVRDETGDCSGCDTCEWIVEYDFTTGDTHAWLVNVNPPSVFGVYTGALFNDNVLAGRHQLFFFKPLADIDLTGMSVLISCDDGSGLGNTVQIYNLTSAANPLTADTQQGATQAIPNTTPFAWTVYSLSCNTGAGIAWYGRCDTNGTGYIQIEAVRLRGTGVRPQDGVLVDSLT